MCIRIGDYAHAGCRVTNAFKKRLTDSITTLTVGVVGVRRIATDFADLWSTLLADVKHVAPADRLFQRTTKAGQFDISTSMLFSTDPKYHVRIVNGLKNHFLNTMFGGVLLWTLIEVSLRNMCSLYRLVPCVKRTFEWEIHGSANLATFCCVLRITWCHCVRFSCYLCQNGGTINVSKIEVLTSCLVPHIRWCSVESGVNSPKFTHRFTQDSHKSETVNFVRICTNFARICPAFHRFTFLQLSKPFVI